jgi:hypothetical protein
LSSFVTVEPMDPISDITFNTLLMTAECYERELTHEHYHDVMTSLQDILLRWAASVPHDMRTLLRDRITRLIEFIQTREFILDLLWLKANELCVRYETDGVVEMYVSITPKYILVKDCQFNMREAAFPLLQPSH